MDIKYIRIAWLDKKIRELREKIKRYKLKNGILVLLLLTLPACTIPLRIIQEQKIVNKEPLFFDNDHPIVKAFAKNGLSREEIMPYLYDYNKDDFDGFYKYMKEKFPSGISADWYLSKLYDRIKIDYNYFVEKGKYEK